jgi:thioredoxin reductase (NADPH)
VTGLRRPGPTQREVVLEGDEDALLEQLHAFGWTDGLPVVVPTRERVERFCAHARHEADEVLGRIAPRGAELTTRILAANAVMAGCLPDHLPVLEAAIEGMLEESFNLFGMQTTTHPCALLVIVHGPAADRLGMASGAGAFGPGNRANGGIGRAIRLVMMNVGGAIPGSTDRATQGSPAKWSWCFAENAADTPWEPYHVAACGMDEAESAVTVAAVEGPHNVNDHSSETAEELLFTIAETMTTPGSNTLYRGGDHFVVLGPEHAALCKRSGFSRVDVQAYLYEKARVPIERIGSKKLAEASGWGGYGTELDGYAGRIPIARAPDEIRILVAGGPGKHSSWIPTFGPTYSQTRRLVLPERSEVERREAAIAVRGRDLDRFATRVRETASTGASRPIREPSLPPDAREEIVIVGGGPAGLSAALYAARARLAPLVVEGARPGGLLQETGEVENFPGYPRGVEGPQLVADLREQAARFGARFVGSDASGFVLAKSPGDFHEVLSEGARIRARTIVLAMGARPRPLGVPGEEALRGRGVAYCAVCDAPLFAGRDVLVVGGGDSAMEEALGLARHARRVVLVHRRPTFRASPILVERVRGEPRIEIFAPFEVVEFVAGGDGRLVRARLRRADDGESHDLAVDGAFIAIGHVPESALVRGQIDLRPDGTIPCREGTRETSVAGVFACGDLVDSRYRQAVTAAGSGCEAALDAIRHLDRLGSPVG